MTWKLANAEARAMASSSFSIPPRAARESLRVGNLAKLIFVDPTEDGGERMWVEIVAVEGTRYQGLLRNIPVVILDLDPSATIDFGPEHVADYEDDYDDSEGD
jgi:hypothetical protein